MQRNNDMTSRYLLDAGISKGMRVLELGFGNGEVTAILLDLVGEDGFVLGLDQNSEMLSKMKSTFVHHSKEQLSLLKHDITGPLGELEHPKYPPFDAIVCRRVLMYLPAPERVIERLACLLKPMGLLVVEEADLTMVPTCTSRMPAHELASSWLEQLLLAENVNLSMGFDLPKVFSSAGFSLQGVRANAVIEGQGQQYTLAEMIVLLKTRLCENGISNLKQIDTLAEQLQREAQRSDFVYVSGMSFCAWGAKLESN